MSYFIIFYALLIFVGGLIGHAKGSTASLVMGSIFGILLLVAGAGMFSKKFLLKSSYAALILTFILDAFFSYRYLTSFKFMPTGMLALVSLGVMIFLVNYLRRLSPSNKFLS